jgi:hypothetical protein
MNRKRDRAASGMQRQAKALATQDLELDAAMQTACRVKL